MPDNNTEDKAVSTVVTEHITHLQDLVELVRCNSGHVFNSRNCKLVPFVTTDRLDDVVYVDQNYEIKQGASSEQKKKLGYLPACPECGLVHLNGFPRATPDQNNDIYPGYDNTVPDRNLTVD